jgi:hypothetical protein
MVAGPKPSGEWVATQPLAHRARIRQEPGERERQVHRAHVETVHFGDAELQACAHRVHCEAWLAITGDPFALFLKATPPGRIAKS